MQLNELLQTINEARGGWESLKETGSSFIEELRFKAEGPKGLLAVKMNKKWYVYEYHTGRWEALKEAAQEASEEPRKKTSLGAYYNQFVKKVHTKYKGRAAGPFTRITDFSGMTLDTFDEYIEEEE